MSAGKSATELQRDFYYLNQFGFTRAPVTVGDGGDQKLRRFATALCNVAGADGEVSEGERAFIMGYCALKGYPQSILDDIPKMCRASESKTIEDMADETRELLAMGTLKKSSRQIVYDAIRAASADGLDDAEKAAISRVAEALGVGGEELEGLHELVEKENELRQERIRLLFPNGHPCLP